MPIVENNPAVAGASGMLGKNFVYRRAPNGKTIIANRPKKRKGGLSEKQAAVVNRFRYATEYAKNVTKNPEYKALYQRGINKQRLILSAYNVAINDCLNPPTIEEVDVKDYNGEPGKLIRARAKDDFMVKSVHVTIRNGDEQIIEQGEATPRGKKGLWRYQTTVRNLELKGTTVTVVVKDLPENVATKRVTVL